MSVHRTPGLRPIANRRQATVAHDAAVQHGAIQRGAIQQLDVIFNANVDDVFGFVFARCGSRSMAEEVTSDTFAEAARLFNDGRAAEVGRGWLFHVARLRLVDHWRRNERNQRRVNRLRQHLSTASTMPVDSDPAVGEAIEALSQRQRMALTLRYLDDYSVAQVAEAMELGYEAAESLLARARRSFHTAYTEVTQGGPT